MNICSLFVVTNIPKKKMHHLISSLLITTTTLILLPKSTPLPHHFLSRATDELHAPQQQNPTPTRREFFEVTRPVGEPNTVPCRHNVLLSHDFGYTYGRSPVSAPYAPPYHCGGGSGGEFSSIVLEWSATCQGRQFDRIFGVWIGGVELLRSCTAEPTRDGIFWKVRKDVSRYNSLLMTGNQTLQVYLGNIVDKTYTGVYHVNVTIYYYPQVTFDDRTRVNSRSSELYTKWADKILPISRNLPLKDGLWFEVENPTDVESKEVVIPQNVYRAVLEVYVSFHENDESWYSNLPNGYIVANNLTGNAQANGPFREVLVSLDGDLVGAIFPFTVIFTGGVNPLLWRPISAIGSFDLPTYDIEITPFLGKLLDGKPHSFGFSVTNALNVWYVDANLHLWLDKKLTVTKGQLLEHNVNPVKLLLRSGFKGLNGKFFTGASRSVAATGWVESSHGNITTTSIQSFDFENHMVLGKDGNMQIVNQTIDYNTSVIVNLSPLYMIGIHRTFPLFLFTDEVDQGNKSYTYQSNLTLGFNEKRVMAAENEVSSSSLRNFQKGEGNMLVKNNLVTSGLGSTHQVYDYDENKGGICYFRNVSSYNYTVLYDQEMKTCSYGSQNFVSGLLVGKPVLV